MRRCAKRAARNADEERYLCNLAGGSFRQLGYDSTSRGYLLFICSDRALDVFLQFAREILACGVARAEDDEGVHDLATPADRTEIPATAPVAVTDRARSIDVRGIRVGWEDGCCDSARPSGSASAARGRHTSSARAQSMPRAGSWRSMKSNGRSCPSNRSAARSPLRDIAGRGTEMPAHRSRHSDICSRRPTALSALQADIDLQRANAMTEIPEHQRAALTR